MKLRSLIYRQYGAFPDATGIVEDRTGDPRSPGATRWRRSLIQQRERLLDLCEEMVSELIDDALPADAHAEDWDLDALRPA